MGKTELKKLQKQESLLESAFHLFTTNGFQKTSISDIAQRAGVAKGTFYLYFTDKFDLRNKLIIYKADRIFLKAFQALDENPGLRFEDQIIFLVNHILCQLEQNPALVRFIARQLSWGFFKHILLEGGDGQKSQTWILYHELLEKSPCHIEAPERMFYMIIEFVSSTSYNTILYGQPMSLAEFKPHMFDVIRYIIRRETVESGSVYRQDPSVSSHTLPESPE